MKINARQILAISFLVVIGGIVAWYLFMYQAQLESIQRVQAEINKLNGQLNQGNMSISQLPQLKNSVNELVAEFDSLSTMLPVKDSVSVMTAQIVRTALSNDLAIDEITPSLDAILKSPDYFVKVPITMKITGPFLQFGAFLEDVKFLPFHFYITNLVLKRTSEFAQIQADLEAYFYVINPGGKI
ncbi:MAG: hypothetical protein D6762_03350 [Candidatus Neomarinimicrobiota bacterium]|nr:MAG: hypothetical protein D6762_03350 [Candidatus Neomarinimicrobiota bacterium]